MPVSALPAMRAAIAYSAPAGGETWADYANGVLDSLLAIEFRNASSLAGATLYGSAPSIVTQPGGGLNLTSTGLVCRSDTLLDTGILIPESQDSITAMFVLVSDRYSNTPTAAGAWESLTTPRARMYIAPWNTQVIFAFHGLLTGISPISSGLLGFIGLRAYVDGSNVGTIATQDGNTVTKTIYIGGSNSYDAPSASSIDIGAFLFGTLKAGQDADTVASELHTRMQTGAL